MPFLRVFGNGHRLIGLNTSRADREQFEQGFLRLAHSALAGLGEEPQSPSSTTQSRHSINFLGPEGQPFCNGLVDLLKQADAVIYVYDQLAKRTPQPPPVQDIRASFVGEKEMAETTIQAGKHVVETEVDKLLAGGLHSVRNGSNTLTAEEEQQGRLLLARGMGQETPGKQTRGWGKVARDTERAMQKLCFPKT